MSIWENLDGLANLYGNVKLAEAEAELVESRAQTATPERVTEASTTKQQSGVQVSGGMEFNKPALYVTAAILAFLAFRGFAK